MMMSVRELRALEIERRAINSAYHILETGDTIRGTAKCMGVSKSTTHKDLQERLPQMGKLALHDAVQEILDIHVAEKHQKGGEMTKQKYAQERKYQAVKEQVER